VNDSIRELSEWIRETLKPGPEPDINGLDVMNTKDRDELAWSATTLLADLNYLISELEKRT
jgi:beta-xylosidase